MVRLVISFLCVLGTLFIYVMITSPELFNNMKASVFFSFVPLIFLAGSNLVRVSAFSSPKAKGYEFVRYIGAVLVLIIIGLSYSPMLELFNDDKNWTNIYAAWLILLQVGFLITPFLSTKSSESVRL